MATEFLTQCCWVFKQVQLFWKALTKHKGTLPDTYTLDELQDVCKNAHSNLVWIKEETKTELRKHFAYVY